MRSKHALTLQTQLTLPMIPFVIDTFARAIFLLPATSIYEVPDLVTFLATYAFFSLGVMFQINPHALASDEEATTNVELVRQRLLATAIISVTLAGGVSFFRAIDVAYPALHLYRDRAPLVLGAIALFVLYSAFRIFRTYLTYINRPG